MYGEPVTDKLLDFLVAGVQKGGTTALWHFLRQHPQIQLPCKKELHFFDNEKIDWSNPPYDELADSAGPPQTAKLTGEATPIYTYWPPSAKRIHSYNPDIKLIVTLRDPVMRAFSHWRMERARGNETLPFSEAIRSGRSRVSESGLFGGCHRIFSYVERGFYAAQINRILDLFGKEQVLIVRHSDLKSCRDKVLDDICDFLGVGPFSSYPSDEVIFSHAGANADEVGEFDAAYLRSVYHDDLTILRRRFAIDIEPEIRTGLVFP